MVAKPGEPYYTVSRINIEGQEAYEGDGKAGSPDLCRRSDITNGSGSGCGHDNLLTVEECYTFLKSVVLPGGLLSSIGDHDSGYAGEPDCCMDDIGPGSHSAGGRSHFRLVTDG